MLGRVILISLVLGLGGSLQAQVATSLHGHNQHWLNMGIGGALGKNAGALGSGFTASYHPPGRLISIRKFSAPNNRRFSEIDPDENRPDYPLIHKDVGLLYGIINKKKWAYYSASAGVGVMWGEKVVAEGTEPRESFRALGIPYEVQLFFSPFAEFGIGLSFSGNINRELSYRGLLLCLQMGVLR